MSYPRTGGPWSVRASFSRPRSGEAEKDEGFLRRFSHYVPPMGAGGGEGYGYRPAVEKARWAVPAIVVHVCT